MSPPEFKIWACVGAWGKKEGVRHLLQVKGKPGSLQDGKLRGGYNL